MSPQESPCVAARNGRAEAASDGVLGRPEVANGGVLASPHDSAVRRWLTVACSPVRAVRKR